MCWETNAQEGCDGRGNVYLTDGTWGGEVFLYTRACCHEERGNRGVEVTFRGGNTVTVEAVEAFFNGEEDITALWTINTQENAILVAQADAYNATTSGWVTVVVQIVDDLFFKRILVSWIYNTVFVAALKVDVDVVRTNLDSTGLFPVNVAGRVAVFVLNHNGVAQFFHNRNVEAAVFANHWRNFFANDEAVVTHDENGPVFFEVMEETAEVVVGLTIGVNDEFLIFFFVGVFPWFKGFAHVPKLVTSAVYVVKVGEDNIIVALISNVVQAICLPLAVKVPRWNKYIANEVCFFATDKAYWWYWATSLGDFWVDSSWVPEHIVGGIESVGNPHTYHGAIFSKFEHLVAAAAWLGFFFLGNIVNDTSYHFAVFNNNDWFFCLFVLVNSYAVVLAFFVL